MSAAYPAVQTLHALQERKPSADENTNFRERKVWLVYWLLWVAGSILLHYFDWLISLPFYVISFYIEIYTEAQIGVVLFLVNPWSPGLDKVLVHVDNLDQILHQGLQKMQQAITPVLKPLLEKVSGGEKGPTTAK